MNYIHYSRDMRETIRTQWSAKVAIVLFIFFAFWGLSLHYLPKNSPLHEYFGSFYGVMALWGALCGIVISKHWGGFKSVMGKTILLFSLGLFAQEFGQIAYSYYIFYLHNEIPYPSLGDIGFFGTIPLYILGSFYLAKASGVNISLHSFQNKLQAVIIPAILLFIGYFLFLRDYVVDFSNPLKLFLDFGYPLGQAVYLSIGILTYSLTRKLLGGVMKKRILFFIAAFSAQFLADYSFIYFQDAYYPGSFIDFMYLIAYFLMTIAILQIETVYQKLRHTSDS